jgi:hypothetical protein
MERGFLGIGRGRGIGVKEKISRVVDDSPKGDDRVDMANVAATSNVDDVADNVNEGNDHVVLDDLEHDSSSHGSKQPNVEQLIANAHNKFDEAMNKINSDIANMASSSELNNSSGTKTPPTSFNVAMQSQMYGTNENMNQSVTSDPNAVDTTSGNGVKSVSYVGVASSES